MGLDRNTIIGFVLIGIINGWNVLFQRQKQAGGMKHDQERVQDSTDIMARARKAKMDSLAASSCCSNKKGYQA